MSDLSADWGNALMPTRSGLWIDLLNPAPSAICIADIAYHLSHISRFTGSVGPYSVAQHSCLVHDILPADKQLAGLLHDASEAYLNDITRPMKVALVSIHQGVRLAFDCLTARFDKVIAGKFGLPETFSHDSEVKRADETMLHTEAVSFKSLDHEKWPRKKDLPAHLDWKITVWDHAQAEREFLDRFYARVEVIRKEFMGVIQ